MASYPEQTIAILDLMSGGTAAVLVRNRTHPAAAGSECMPDTAAVVECETGYAGRVAAVADMIAVHSWMLVDRIDSARADRVALAVAGTTAAAGHRLIELAVGRTDFDCVDRVA